LTTCLVWAIEYGVGVCDNALPYQCRGNLIHRGHRDRWGPLVLAQN
jgi:hypothetical protein